MPESALTQSQVFVVIPAFNEAAIIGEVLLRLKHHIGENRIIVVDDCSNDATASEARQQGVIVLRHLVNRGQGASLATGIAAALRLDARIIVTFDADGQHDPADIPVLAEPILKDEADVVLGTRFSPDNLSQVPPVRRLLLRFAAWMTRLSSNLKVSDTHNGFRALSANAARLIRIREPRMAHASEILDEIARHRLRYTERPVHIRYTDYALAKGQKNRDAFKLALRILYSKVAR